jgi:hypothetical protein
MDLPCQNHFFPIRHKLRECELLKRFISKPPTEKAKSNEPLKLAEQETPTKEFPEMMGCLMIFGGTKACDEKCHLKTAHREVHAAEPTIPRYLQWLEFPIIFNHQDHPDRIPHPRAYPSLLSQP